MSKYDMDEDNDTVILDVPKSKPAKKRPTPEVMKAIAKDGESLGFVDRSPKAIDMKPQRRGGRRSKEPQDRVLIAGPLRVLDAFREHCDQTDQYYWEALEAFLKEQGASKT